MHEVTAGRPANMVTAIPITLVFALAPTLLDDLSALTQSMAAIASRWRLAVAHYCWKNTLECAQQEP